MFQALISPEVLKTLYAGGAAPLVLDVSFDLTDPDAGRRQFEAGHLPGARYLHLDEDLSAPKTGTNGRHPLPTREDMARRAATWGVRPGVQVVAVDRSAGTYAARLWWMLRWIGHAEVAVLDGGVAAWQAAGGTLEPGASPPAAREDATAQPPGEPVHARVVDALEVLALITSPSHVIVDARSPERFRGDVEPLDPVAGHIPGALNHPFGHNLGADGRFKSADALRAQWLGFLAGRPATALVHQCGSGVTACHNLLALAAAGLEGGALYPGSWSEWCADPARPIARG